MRSSAFKAQNAILFLLCLAFPSLLIAQTTETLTTSGSWTVPCGVTSVVVECWGAGGGGGNGATAATGGGGGGGGGEYAKKTLTVVSGANLSYIIGGGGAAGTAGGNTTWNTTDVVANGGGAGADDGGVGGSGGTGGTGTVLNAGGSGATGGPGDGAQGAGGGGSGGSASAGNNGTVPTAGAAVTDGGAGADGGANGANGNNAAQRGGGGGGAGERVGGAETGGLGFRGEIKLTYSGPAPGTYSIGPSGDDFTSIGEAHCALLLNGTLTGAYIFELQSDYVSSVESFEIMIGAIPGMSAANTVTFRPAAGATGLTIENAYTGSNGMITMNGGDYFIFDGRPGGAGGLDANCLAIKNTELGSGTPSSVLLFVEDASNNVFQYCQIEGEAQNANNGLIEIGTTTLTTGSDENVFSYCRIGDLQTGGSAYRPQIGIQCNGTTGKENSSITIDNCEFVDIYYAGATCSDIWVSTAGTDWTITDNHFYQTVDYPNLADMSAHVAVQSGGGYIVTGNSFGGRASNCGGTAMTFSNATAEFRAINFLSTSGNACTISNNVITNIQFTGTGTGATYTPFYIAGTTDYTIGSSGLGNTIGSSNGVDNIIVTANGSTGSMYGFVVAGSGSINIGYNSYGGIRLDGTTADVLYYPIHVSAGIVTIDNNTFGSETTANSIRIASSSDSPFLGVFSNTTGNFNVTNNTFQNIKLEGATEEFTAIYSPMAPFVCSGNTIKDINVAGTQGSYFIRKGGPSATISSNTISNVTAAGPILGITNEAGANGTISNNTIGGIGSNNIVSTADAVSNAILGMGTGNCTITGNTIQGWFVNNNAGTTAGLKGISLTAGIHNVDNNTIKDMQVDCSTASVALAGIDMNGPTDLTQSVSGNVISDLRSINTSTTGTNTYGLKLTTGGGTAQKNLIEKFQNLSTGTSSTFYGSYHNGTFNHYNNVVLMSNEANTNDVTFYGIYDYGDGANYYHNTVLITGSGGGAPNNSMCFYKSASAVGTMNIMNNVFVNQRTNDGVSYAFYFADLTPAPTSNYNYAEAADHIGYDGVDRTTMANWNAAAGGASSVTGSEAFNANGSPQNPSFTGSNLANDLSGTVSDDMNGAARSATPWAGAFEGGGSCVGFALNPSQNNASCNGVNGSATSAPTAGTTPYTYVWSNAATTNAINVPAGTYALTISDNASCVLTHSYTLTEPTAITISLATVNTVCMAASGSVTATVSGGTTAYTYAWSNGATSAAITGLNAGNFDLTLTDANSCQKTGSGTVTDLGGSLVVSNNTTNPTNCGSTDGTASVSSASGTTPYTYLWSNTATTNAVSGLGAGTISATMTDANGCVGNSGALSITSPGGVPMTLTPSVTHVSNCGAADGAVSVVLSGGSSPFTYQWSNGTTATTISGLSPGTHTISVVDNCGALATTVANVSTTIGSALSVSITSNPETCSNGQGALNAAVSGGSTPYTYVWSNAGNLPSQTGLAAGSYSVSVTDNCLSMTTQNVTLTNDLGNVTVTVSSVNAICNSQGSASVQVGSGQSPYSFNWNSGPTTATITGLVPSTYMVTATDADGCLATGLATIVGMNNTITVTSTVTHATCATSNGSISSLGSGGTVPYSYTWSNSTPLNTITGLGAGAYTVTVLDSDGCSGAASYLISVTPPTQNQVKGLVTIAATTVSEGTVYLLQTNQGTEWDTIAQVAVGLDGSYEFSNVDSGSYTIMVSGDGGIFTTSMTTYYGGVYDWSLASTFALLCDTVIANIELEQFIATNSGVGKISGYVYYETEGKTAVAGDPIPGLEIMLDKTPPSGVMASTTTNTSGYYEFVGLEHGIYTVLINMPGVGTTSSHEIIITEMDSIFTNMNYGMDSTKAELFVSQTSTAAVQELMVADMNITLYPNPAQDVVNVITGTTEVVRIELNDVNGRRLLEKKVVGNDQLDLQGLAAGVYFITIRSNEAATVIRLIKE